MNKKKKLSIAFYIIASIVFVVFLILYITTASFTNDPEWGISFSGNEYYALGIAIGIGLFGVASYLYLTKQNK